MKRTAIVVFAAGVALAAVLVGVASAQTATRPAVRERRVAVRAELRGLELSPDQKARVKSIVQTHKAEVQKLRQDRQAARQQQDQAALKALAANAQTLRQGVQAEIVATLTPEQQQRLQRRNQAIKRRLADRRPPVIRK